MTDYSEIIVRLEESFRAFDETMRELEQRADEAVKTETKKIDRAKIEEVLGNIKNISANT